MEKPIIPMIELTRRGKRLKGLLYEMDRTGNSPKTMMKIYSVLNLSGLSDAVAAKRSGEFTCAYLVYMVELMNADTGCPTKEVKLSDLSVSQEGSSNAH